MSRSSGRGTAEPLAALVAVAAVCVGLSVYAGVAVDALPSASRDPEQTLGIVADHVAPDGVAYPRRLQGLARPEGGGCNVTLAVGDRRWTYGPSPPPRAERARRRLPVRRGNATVETGWLEVTVW